MTEKPKLVIPWGKMIEDLASWIKKECYPKGFQWKHPSKIKIQDIFGLLDYWRERSAEGEEPLIWVTTSPLFDVIHRTRDRNPKKGITSIDGVKVSEVGKPMILMPWTQLPDEPEPGD